MTHHTSLVRPRSASPAPAASAQPTAGHKGLFVTDAAVAYAKQKLEKRGTPDAAVRVGVRGGGCAGYTYAIEFDDDAPRERDKVFEFGGVKFHVDRKSLIVLAGTTLDYERTLMYQGFKFINPQAATSCSCGHSFMVG